MKTQISDIIDNMGVSKFTWKVFLLICFIILFDGFDNMIVAYTMPQISKAWALTKLETGSLASWGLLGLMFGALIAGSVSDKIGRKKTILFFGVVYSIFSGLIFFAPNFETFALLRVLSGFGLGAVTPVGATMVSEFVPSKNRGAFVTGTLGFFICGWILAGILAINVIPILGWRALYLIGMLPLLYLIVVAIKLPESPRWLLSKGREEEAIKIIQDIERTVKGVAGTWAAGSLVVPPRPKVVGLRAFFTRDYRKVTMKLWALNFFMVMIVYGITSWLPSLLVAQGYSVVKSYSFSIFQNIAAIIGVLSGGYISDQIGRKKNGTIGFVLLGAAVLLLGFAGNQWQLLVFIIIVGFLMNYASANIQPLAVEAYPTEFRNTGMGWSQGVGRLGGAIGPLAIGFLQQQGFGLKGTLSMLVFPILFCVVIVFFFDADTKGKSLESINNEMTA